MYKIRVSDNARKDMEKMVDYISSELNNPAAAYDLLAEIEKRFELILNNPHMYQLCEGLKDKKNIYRKFCVNNYVIIYTVEEPEHVIRFHRLFYGRQDYINLI